MQSRTESRKYSCFSKNHFNGFISFSGSLYSNIENPVRVLTNRSDVYALDRISIMVINISSIFMLMSLLNESTQSVLSTIGILY